MERDHIEKTWQILVHAERQLYKQFNSIRSVLPVVTQRPNPLRIKESHSVPREPSHYGGLLNNMNSPQSQTRTFSHVFRPTVDLASFLPPREALCKPRPLARYITDPHSRSNVSMPLSKTPKRPPESGFKSILYLSPPSSRSHSCERGLPASHLLFRSKKPPIKQIRIEETPGSVQALATDKTHSLLNVFPQRSRRHYRRLHPMQGFEPSQQLDYMIREQAYHRPNPRKFPLVPTPSPLSTKKLTFRLRDEASDLQKSRILPANLTLADEDDEDKCVVEGEVTNLVVHLPKY